MEGPKEIVDFFGGIWKSLSENLVIHGFRYQDNWLFVELSNTLTVFEDMPDFVTGPLKKGEHPLGRGKVAYKIRNGRISAIYDGIDPTKE
jgi:hypothetical protein